MVGFHVIHNDIIDLTVANHLTNIVEILRKEVGLNSIYECYLLVVDDV
jgi:hypothetical protein